jgi:NAD(P)-dependent dehydrogenase (short-subunit alcohol dehydrogenase family)
MRPEQRGIGLSGTVALITGGGRGIGRLVARALASAGAAVGLIARSSSQLTESVQLITEAGGRAEAAAADASNPAAIQRAVSELHDKLGPVSLLVNNAGIAGPAGNAWDVPAEAWWQTIEVNLGGTFLCTRLVLPSMTARGAGRIINITSNAGVLRWPQVSAYAVSKAAIIKLTENLATETCRNGVGIFSVDPGLLPMGLGAAAVACTATPGSAEARRDTWIRQQLAAGRGAEPAWVTRLIMRIAVGDADELSGCHLSVHDDLDMMLALARHLPERDMYRLRRYQPADTTQPRTKVVSTAGKHRNRPGYAWTRRHTQGQ